MSWDTSLYGELDGNRIELFDINYTHNCNAMVRTAGFVEFPYEVDGWSAKEFGDRLGDAIAALRADPKTYRAMNPLNGWGDYDSLIGVLRELHEACRKWPSAQIGMSA